MTEIPARCIEWDEDLSALVDEELSAEREAELRAHIDSCERCTRRLQELCDVDLSLASLPALEVPGDLAARLAARIEVSQPAASVAEVSAAMPSRPRTAPPAPRRRATAVRLAAMAAAAAALLLAVWVAVRGPEAPEPVPPLARAAAPEPRDAATPLEEIAPEPEASSTQQQLGRDEPAPQEQPTAEPPIQLAEAGLPELADLHEEDVAMLIALEAIELEAAEDFDVIANLELLERLLDAEAAGDAG